MTTPGPSTTYPTFVPNPATGSGALTADLIACLAAQSATCDTTTVGSLAMGTGACSTTEFADTVLCACVNNSLPCPLFTSPACSNDAGAYQTTDQVSDGNACSKLPMCINFVSAAGSSVVDGVVQTCDTSDTVVNWIETHRAVTVMLVFLAVLALAFLSAAIARHNLSSASGASSAPADKQPQSDAAPASDA
jgi:hypothetical protein